MLRHATSEQGRSLQSVLLTLTHCAAFVNSRSLQRFVKLHYAISEPDGSLRCFVKVHTPGSELKHMEKVDNVSSMLLRGCLKGPSLFFFSPQAFMHPCNHLHPVVQRKSPCTFQL